MSSQLGATVIAGIGETEVAGRGSGRSAERMALESALVACEDAGIDPAEVDGILGYSHDGTLSAMSLAVNLGCRDLRLAADVPHAGGSAGSLVEIASDSIVAGSTRAVLCFRTVQADNWLHQLTSPDPLRPFYIDAARYLRPVGWTGYLHLFGALYQEHRNRYGTPRQALAGVALQLRENARRAGSTIAPPAFTLDDYMDSPMTVSPFTEYDEFLAADVSCAVLITADDTRERYSMPVDIVATAQSHGDQPLGWFDTRPLSPTALDSPTRHVVDELYERSGLSPDHIDVAELYDCTTFTLLYMLEETRMCERGGGAELIAADGLLSDGARPTNTHGGDLAAGYSHGFRHLLEAVRQLRGTAINQVPEAATAVVVGAPAGPTSGVILRRHDA